MADGRTNERPRRYGAPLIGRQEPIETILQAAADVRARNGARVVTIVGPSGVGKSRLVQHVLDALESEPERAMRTVQGASRVPSSPGYGPIVSLLRARFGLGDATPSDEARTLIRRQVERVLDDRKVGDVCFYLGQLLDLPFPDSPLTKAVADDPKQGELLLRAVIKNFFDSDAAREPLGLVFEDVDGLGSAAMELVRYLIEHLSGPVLVLCTARPELSALQPEWFRPDDDRHVKIELGPLDDRNAESIMKALLSRCEGGPPRDLVEAGVRLANGNPGLLESMVRIFHDARVLEAASESTDAPWRVHLDRLSDVQLPGTVEDTVAMRVAALSGAERHLLEHAATMGAVFWRGALATLAREERKAPRLWTDLDSQMDEIDSLLAAVEQRSYIVRTAPSAILGEAEYSFRHGLEREKLLALLDEDRKRRYHQIVADWLRGHESSLPMREYHALLAFHLERAGQKVSAGLLYLDAADAARESYAAKDAHEYYASGLALLGAADAHRRILALHNHGDVLVVLGHTDEALSTFREMLALAYQLDLKAKGGAAHNRIGRLYRAMGALSDAMAHLETALSLFEAAGDARGVASCHDDVGKLLWTKGDYENALERMRTSLEMRKKIGDRRSIALSLHNIGVVWRDHGQPNQAREALEASLAIRREIGDLIGVAQTLNSMGRLAQDRQDLHRARDLYRQAYDVALEVGERNRIAMVMTNLGEIYYRLGDTAEAIRILKEAEELCDELGDRLHLAEAKRGLAQAYLMQNDLKRARASIKHAVDLFGQVRSKSHLASALRTLGEITAAGAWGAAHEGRAVDYFMRSIALCKEIGNETEIAKSYRSFSDYVASSNHYKNNEEIQREARKLRQMADEIFERQRLSQAGFQPEPVASRS